MLMYPQDGDEYRSLGWKTNVEKHRHLESPRRRNTNGDTSTSVESHRIKSKCGHRLRFLIYTLVFDLQDVGIFQYLMRLVLSKCDVVVTRDCHWVPQSKCAPMNLLYGIIPSTFLS